MSGPENGVAEAHVEVATDPLTAFTLFTDEIDAWWRPGPINFFDAARATGMAIEPGVGGRVLERYGEEPPLVIATVTRWEPGSRLTLRGVVDDTETTVTFAECASGTRVHVRQQALPGARRTFLFWPRVIGWYDTHVRSPVRSVEAPR